jgi:hypothetical protein
MASGKASDGSSRGGILLAYCGRTVKGESPLLIFPQVFQPESVIFNAHKISEGELYLVRDPIDVLKAFESGIENVDPFRRGGRSAFTTVLLGCKDARTHACRPGRSSALCSIRPIKNRQSRSSSANRFPDRTGFCAREVFEQRQG